MSLDDIAILAVGGIAILLISLLAMFGRRLGGRRRRDGGAAATVGSGVYFAADGGCSDGGASGDCG